MASVQSDCQSDSPQQDAWSVNQLNWVQLKLDSYGVAVVMESTGVHLTCEHLQPYFDQGVKKVIVSAPVKDLSDKVINVVVGCNEVRRPLQCELVLVSTHMMAHVSSAGCCICDRAASRTCVACMLSIATSPSAADTHNSDLLAQLGASCPVVVGCTIHFWHAGLIPAAAA
jgi:hypothetical protein